MMDFKNLPGYELIGTGIDDLSRNRETLASLLVAIGWMNLKKSIPNLPEHQFSDPELRLYNLLSTRHGDSAHSRYNALIRRLVSFERALACAD